MEVTYREPTAHDLEHANLEVPLPYDEHGVATIMSDVVPNGVLIVALDASTPVRVCIIGPSDCSASLYVAPGYQRQGSGTGLASRAIDRTKHKGLAPITARGRPGSAGAALAVSVGAQQTGVSGEGEILYQVN
jgi:GNAT superfamily N-acetyltransferase